MSYRVFWDDQFVCVCKSDAELLEFAQAHKQEHGTLSGISVEIWHD